MGLILNVQKTQNPAFAPMLFYSWTHCIVQLQPNLDNMFISALIDSAKFGTLHL